jgi:hypothetical protein
VQDWCPRWASIENATELHQAIETGFQVDQPTLVAVGSFYGRDLGLDLPLDWRTTTDAIAAALTIKCCGDELVLLKSCPVDQSLSIQELAAAGVIDDALPLIADRVRKIRVERLPSSATESERS